MRIVVTGRDGQVVRSLIERASGAKLEIIPLGRPELDLAGSPDSIVNAIRKAAPNVVVSAAAYTQVDLAESERELAFAVNRDGPRAIAQAAKGLGVPLIHLSTDYVFDGLKSSPYVEEDKTGPTGVYGASKLAGEEAALVEHHDTAVIRTAWIYSPFGKNFVKTMLQLAESRAEVSVVADQRGNPTSALDIADGILRVAINLASSDDPAQRGIFHMTASGEASWADFAQEIYRRSAESGGPSAIVKHIGSAGYPTAAKRPANSCLDSSKLEKVHGVRLSYWPSSLKDVVSRLLDRGA